MDQYIGYSDGSLTAYIERFSCDLEKWFWFKGSLFVVSGKDQTWTLRFPAIENPNMEKA